MGMDEWTYERITQEELNSYVVPAPLGEAVTVIYQGQVWHGPVPDGAPMAIIHTGLRPVDTAPKNA